MYKINVFSEKQDRFDVVLSILSRKTELSVTYTDTLADDAINLGFAYSEAL